MKIEEVDESNILSTNVDSPSNSIVIEFGVVIVQALYFIFEVTSYAWMVEDVVVVIHAFLIK